MKYKIDKVNWPEAFPEKPEVSVEVSNNHEFLHLHYRVRGAQLRAVTTEDQGPVWEDSCVEFFCQVPGEPYYMNFETNCIGAMVASRRKGRAEDVQPLPPEQMAQIERRCTYPRQAIAEQDGLFEWEVAGTRISAGAPCELLQVRRQDQEAALPELAAYTVAQAGLPLSAVLWRDSAGVNEKQQGDLLLCFSLVVWLS